MTASTPRIDKFENPTLLSDVEATALGKKVYTHGGIYYLGGAPTVTLFSGGESAGGYTFEFKGEL